MIKAKRTVEDKTVITEKTVKHKTNKKINNPKVKKIKKIDKLTIKIIKNNDKKTVKTIKNIKTNNEMRTILVKRMIKIKVMADKTSVMNVMKVINKNKMIKNIPNITKKINKEIKTIIIPKNNNK